MRHPTRRREEARQLYLTGEVDSIAEIARRLKIKAHTVARWKKDEDWDALRIKISKRAAEQMAERIANERVNLNSQHFKLWGAIVSRLFTSVSKDGLRTEEIRNLERMASILDRAQKGQRLARGLSLDGETEEQIRAEAEAECRSLVDLFIEVVKQEVSDEDVRDRISRALMARVPPDPDQQAA